MNSSAAAAKGEVCSAESPTGFRFRKYSMNAKTACCSCGDNDSTASPQADMVPSFAFLILNDLCPGKPRCPKLNRYRDIPSLTDEQLANAYRPRGKALVSVRLDQDVLAWFKSFGETGYSSRLNGILRTVMEKQLSPRS